MAAGRSESGVRGAEIIATFLEVEGTKVVQNALRAGVQAVASKLAKEMKSKIVKGDTGKLRRGIYAKRRNALTRGEFISDIAFKDDVWYWRFVEFGTGLGDGSHLAKQYTPGAAGFVRDTLAKYEGELPQMINEQFAAKLEKAFQKAQAKAAARARQG